MSLVGKDHDLPLLDILNQDVGLSVIVNQKLSLVPAYRFGRWKEGTERVTKSVDEKKNELIKRLGKRNKAGSYEVLPENKQKFYVEYRALMIEKDKLFIPEINLSLIKDVPTNIRFTTLVGQYLKDDTKYDTIIYKNITVKMVADLDIAPAIIVNEALPMHLAIKLGIVKRVSEKITREHKEFKEELLKELGELNNNFDYVLKGEKDKEFEEKVKGYENSLVKVEGLEPGEIELPVFYLDEFDTTININGEDTPVEFPARFFAYFMPYIKEERPKEESKKGKSSKKQ